MAVPTDQQQQQQQLTSAQGSAAPEVAHTDSPTINVTNEEGHHAAAPEVAEESPSSGPQTSHNNRVQWSQELPTPAQNQSDSNLDPETLAKLKESAKGVSEASRPIPLANNQPQTNPLGVGQEGSDYFNFEGMDSEMVIPSGETDGLPSLKARRNAARKQKAKQQPSKAFGQRLKAMFGGGSDSQTSSLQDPEKNPDASADTHDQNSSSDDEEEEDDTHGRPAQQPFSVLGNLLALRDADHSGNSTAASSTTSLEQYDEHGNPIDNNKKSATAAPQEKDIGKEPLGSAPPSPRPEGGTTPTTDASTLKGNKSQASLFSLKGHPAFLDKPGKYFNSATSAAQSALSTPGGVAKTVAKNLKGDSSAAKKRRREKKKDLIRAKLAAIMERQSFIMKLTRALMMFGSPSHRLEALITNTGTFLEAPLQCVFTPGVMTLSFIDPATRTSETKFIKQGTGLDLHRLPIAQKIYRHAMHGRCTVKEASDQLDELMLQGPQWNAWQTVILGMFASAWITPLAFGGGFVDALGAMMLGGLLVAVQMTVSKVEAYANIFEIFIAAVNSFIASALASTDYFCFSAVTSGSVVLILPGFIVLCGSLELTARNISAGSVRMFYAIIYSLLLGFGLSLGSQTWYLFTGHPILGTEALSCNPGNDAAWWLKPSPAEYNILFAPMFMLFLAMRNQATPKQKELILMVLIGSAGYTVNYFVSHNNRFDNRADFSSALGCFAVGILGNLYSRFTNGNGFAVMAPGVLFQLPSGLSASGGLLTYASTNTTDSGLASASQNIGQTLISIAIGITVGLFFASALVNPQSGSTRKQAAYFAF